MNRPQTRQFLLSRRRCAPGEPRPVVARVLTGRGTLRHCAEDHVLTRLSGSHSAPRAVRTRALTGLVRQAITPPAELKGGYDLLSDREREILVLLAEGMSLKEIATKLALSVKTVDAHKYNLMRKLDLHDRSELIRYAVRKKLVEV